MTRPVSPWTLGLGVLHVLFGLLLCALVIVVALSLRIVYETVMLPVRVWRAERRPAAADDPGGMEMDDSWARPRGTVIVQELQPVTPEMAEAFVRAMEARDASVQWTRTTFHHPV